MRTAETSEQRLTGLYHGTMSLIIDGKRDQAMVDALLDAHQLFKDKKPFAAIELRELISPYLPAPKKVRDFLQKIYRETTEEQGSQSRVYGKGLHRTSKRPYTREEFKYFFAVAKSYSLPLVIDSVNFGHTFAVWMYDHSRPADTWKPQLLTVMLQDQIPGVNRNDYQGEGYMDACYARVIGSIKRPANLQLLKFYQLPLPQEAGHYHY